MLSKASYLMQDHLRYSYTLITDVLWPRVFIVRGRLAFPQGLAAIARFFDGGTPAAVYAHGYFIERTSDPTQPSPSWHLTEEMQSVMKVTSGLRYMTDDQAKLDNTMVFVSDDTVTARGRMLRFAQVGTARVRRTHKAVSAAAAAAASSVEAMHSRTRGAAASVRRAAAPTSAAVENTFGFVKRGSGAPSVRSLFPATEQSTSDAAACRAYFRAVHAYRRTQAMHASTPGDDDDDDVAAAVVKAGGRCTHTSSTVPVDSGGVAECHDDACSSSAADKSNERDKRDEDDDDDGFDFVEVSGAYTVLYNPIEVNEVTFGDVLDKLHYEGRCVACIVVPTRQTWRQVQVWADAFPDAQIVSSHDIPIAEPHTGSSNDKSNDSSNKDDECAAVAGGMCDMGNGVMGLHFPDLSDEDMQDSNNNNSKTTSSTHNDNSRDGGDPADVLWRTPLASVPAAPLAGLRAADASRVRVLCSSSSKSSNSRGKVIAQPIVPLTSTIALYYIAGDAVTDEYVLHDRVSGVVACTDVFHGAYGDYDPVNSWLCRVWFKFMKKGNYKRIDCVPRFKWLQVRQQGTLSQLRGCIDALTRTCAVRYLVAAHGTPPHTDDAANALRVQWGMPVLTQQQLPPLPPHAT